MKDAHDLFLSPSTDSYDFREKYSQTVDGYRRYRALRTALDVELFDILTRPMTASEIAEQGFDRDMIQLLCDLLVEMGYLGKEGERYVDTEESALYMNSGSPLFLGTTYDLLDDSLRSWDLLVPTLRDGRGHYTPMPNRFHYSMTAFGYFSKGGFIASMMDFMDSVGIRKGSRILDVAGGHGLYSVAMRSRYPDCDITYFDREVGAEVARSFFKEYDTDIPIITGDYFTGRIPGGFDILLSSFNESACKPELVKKMRDALNPGGMVFLRRYHIIVQDPLERLLQTNCMRTGDGKFTRSPRGQDPEEYEEFERRMKENGFVLVRMLRADNGTEFKAYVLKED